MNLLFIFLPKAGKTVPGQGHRTLYTQEDFFFTSEMVYSVSSLVGNGNWNLSASLMRTQIQFMKVLPASHNHTQKPHHEISEKQKLDLNICISLVGKDIQTLENILKPIPAKLK